MLPVPGHLQAGSVCGHLTSHISDGGSGFRVEGNFTLENERQTNIQESFYLKALTFQVLAYH